MDGYQNNYFSEHNNFINNFVDDSSTEYGNNNEYIEEQNSIIEKHKNKIHPSKEQIKDTNETDNYNPYYNYLYKKGLLDTDNKEKQIVQTINIDSSVRRIKPIINYDICELLHNNPMYIENNILYINYNNNFKEEDVISITGLGYIKKTIRTFTKKTNILSNGSFTQIKKYYVDFVKSLDNNKTIFMRFDIDPNIDVTSINNLDNTNNMLNKEYDLSYNNLYVEISGFKTSEGETRLGNIPFNVLNTQHRVYLSPRELSYSNPKELGKKIIGITDTFEHEDNNTIKSFYIKLPMEFEGDFSLSNVLNIDIIFKHYGGIPINTVNAYYPITGVNISGYHKIHSASSDKIGILLSRNGYFNGSFGGNNMYIKKIKDIEYGYLNPNSYTINLSNSLHNIHQVRLVSTEFPNSEKVFKDDTSDYPNNKLYWQNLDDGDKIYSISINSGNYTSDELITILEKKFYDTQKINYSIDDDNIYTKNNYIKVSIDINTDIVNFTSYKEAIIKKPFVKIKPEIVETDGISGSTAESYDGTYEITINHLNHQLVAGDNILIRDSITYLGIQTALLNVTHKVKEIISKNSYIIELNNINLNILRSNTGGGNGVKIYVPNKIRMRFDYTDTMGVQLGFRNPGNKNSITSYNYVISNNDPYDNEIDIDSYGNEKIIKNNSLILSGSNYILMECKELNGIINLNNIKKIFTKINLSGLPGKVLYNTFIPTTIYYNEPIDSLSSLSFNFYTPEGNLFDFNGLNHSFTIEFVCIDILPKETGISSKTGRLE